MGHTTVVQLLLDAKADVSQPQASNGRTPIHTACEKGRVDMIEMLLAKGADAEHRAHLEVRPLVALPLALLCKLGVTRGHLSNGSNSHEDVRASSVQRG